MARCSRCKTKLYEGEVPDNQGRCRTCAKEAQAGYNRTADAVARAIRVWFETHPGANPQFTFPPERVAVIGDLSIGLEYWSPNDHGKDLVTFVEQKTRREATMLMFQVCYAQYQRRRSPNA